MRGYKAINGISDNDTNLEQEINDHNEISHREEKSNTTMDKNTILKKYIRFLFFTIGVAAAICAFYVYRIEVLNYCLAYCYSTDDLISKYNIFALCVIVGGIFVSLLAHFMGWTDNILVNLIGLKSWVLCFIYGSFLTAVVIKNTVHEVWHDEDLTIVLNGKKFMHFTKDNEYISYLYNAEMGVLIQSKEWNFDVAQRDNNDYLVQIIEKSGEPAVDERGYEYRECYFDIIKYNSSYDPEVRYRAHCNVSENPEFCEKTLKSDFENMLGLHFMDDHWSSSSRSDKFSYIVQ